MQPVAPPAPAAKVLHTNTASAVGFVASLAGAIVAYGPQVSNVLPDSAKPYVGLAISLAGVILIWVGKGPFSPKES